MRSERPSLETLADGVTHHRVFIGDSRDMREVGDESVHLVVTSPPYWCLKDYGHPGQIGYSQSYEEYLDSLRQVLAECLRVLHPGCRAAVNIGDQYLRATEHGRYRVLPIPGDLTRLGIDLGFDFMGSIIWRKISTTQTTGGGTWMGSTYYPGDGHITYEHEYIVLLRKPGRRPPVRDPARREASRLTREQRSAWFRGVWDDLPPDRQNGHIAMFPVELPRRLIRMYTYVGETVLDPFLGSGSTARAALLESRHSIGYELNPDFVGLIREKVVGEGETTEASLESIQR
ncbi:MAG: site-specific DNA-methyltransferase [Armatimonadetes bacterium]|nr:site-specific DNA-methyltransferase [Armatimonadota bacterium]